MSTATSSCNVSSAALTQCQQGFQQLTTLLQQASNDATAYQNQVNARNQEIQNWENQHAQQQQLLQAGFTAPAGSIFNNDGTVVNCTTRAATNCYLGAQCNCNSAAEADKRCTACGFGKCQCTAGIGGDCSAPCSTFTTSTTSTYQAQYNAWLAANPEPAPLAPYVPTPINVGDIICAQCTQCQQFSQIQAQNINVDNISQAQQCVNLMQNQLNAQQAAAASPTASSLSSLSTTKIILLVIVILLILSSIGVSIFFIVRSSKAKAATVTVTKTGGTWSL